MIVDGPGFTLTLEPRAHYLYAHVAGPHDTLDVSLAYWTELAVQCEINAVERLLVVEDLEERSTLADIAEMVEVLSRIGFRDIRIAFVDGREDRGVLAAAELMAKSAGLTGRAFSEFAPAEAWLLADLRADAPPGGGRAR